jgi:inhibitor of cysteine peptidase
MSERKPRKIRVYALVSILLISILAVTVYVYFFSSNTPIPIDNNDVILWPESYLRTSNLSHTVSPMKSFGSYDDLKEFLIVANESSTSGPSPFPPTIIFANADETDTLRANGGYIYILSNETLYVINADPNDAKVLAKIHYSDRSIEDFFISQDGSDLVVVCNKYEEVANGTLLSAERQYKHEVFVGTYDVSQKTNPVLRRNFTISGDYEKRDARIAGSYLYAAVTQQAEVLNGNALVPVLFDGVGTRSLKPSEIFYTNSSIEGNKFGYTYTTLIALNTDNYLERPTIKSVLLGFACTVFSTGSNICFVSPVIDWRDLYAPGFMGTDLYMASVDGASLTFAAQGTMAGMLFDRDSIDEYNGYLRLVSKLLDANVADLQIFDEGLNLKGTLERIAETKNLFGVRFLGDRCYLHIDFQPDRFLVADISNPSHPTVGGEFETGAVQTLLYEVDDNHIISLNDDGGLLFVDVSSAGAPSAKPILYGSGSSQVYYDHASFLFDRTRSLVVFPVMITRAVELGHKSYEGHWQGVLVFDVTSTGLVLKGNVSHVTPYSNPEGELIDLVYDTVSRSICVGDTICTVSPQWMQLNSLDNMDIIAKVTLS